MISQNTDVKGASRTILCKLRNEDYYLYYGKSIYHPGYLFLEESSFLRLWLRSLRKRLVVIIRVIVVEDIIRTLLTGMWPERDIVCVLALVMISLSAS